MNKIHPHRIFWILSLLCLPGILLIWNLFYAQRDLLILCLGDSLTADGYPKQLKQLISKSPIKAKVINKGIRGHTSGEYLHFLKRSKMLEEIEPDIILLQLGTNDVRVDADHTPVSRFIQNMEGILKEIHSRPFAKKKTFRLLIATIPPLNDIAKLSTFDQDSLRRVQEEINPAIKKIAEKWKLILVDNYALFLNKKEWIPDVHPTVKGYGLMAENWLNAIETALNQSSDNPGR